MQYSRFTKTIGELEDNADTFVEVERAKLEEVEIRKVYLFGKHSIDG